jgi:hypothetical protein
VRSASTAASRGTRSFRRVSRLSTSIPILDLLTVGIGTQPIDWITFVVRNPECYQVSNLPLAKRSFAPREQHVAPDDSTDGSPPLRLGSTDRW